MQEGGDIAHGRGRRSETHAGDAESVGARTTPAGGGCRVILNFVQNGGAVGGAGRFDCGAEQSGGRQRGGKPRSGEEWNAHDGKKDGSAGAADHAPFYSGDGGRGEPNYGHDED